MRGGFLKQVLDFDAKEHVLGFDAKAKQTKGWFLTHHQRLTKTMASGSQSRLDRILRTKLSGQILRLLLPCHRRHVSIRHSQGIDGCH